MRSLSISLCLLLCACGGDEDKAVDAGTGSSIDAGTDAAAGGPLATTCTDSCATTSLRAEFGSTTRDFERAFFGLSAPGQSESGAWEIYVEGSAGGDDGCPAMNSPTPLFTLVLAGLPLPTEQSEMATPTVSLVDFEGALLTDMVFEKASASSVTWVAADPCVACAEGSEPDRSDRMIAIDIDATFAGGSVRGHAFATHCDSLDVL